MGTVKTVDSRTQDLKLGFLMETVSRKRSLFPSPWQIPVCFLLLSVRYSTVVAFRKELHVREVSSSSLPVICLLSLRVCLQGSRYRCFLLGHRKTRFCSRKPLLGHKRAVSGSLYCQQWGGNVCTHVCLNTLIYSSHGTMTPFYDSAATPLARLP